MQLQNIKVKISSKIKEKIKGFKHVSLDVGCGAYKRNGAIGMDIRPLPGVDLVHDFNQYPWPIPDNTCMLVTANHVLEHVQKNGSSPQIKALIDLLVKKKILTSKEVNEFVGETEIFSYLIRFMDEAWRVSKVGGQFAIILPYAGSTGFYQDPTHSAAITEATFYYFDPTHISNLWHIYKPQPWKIEMSTYQINGNIEIIMSKLPWIKEYEQAKYV